MFVLQFYDCDNHGHGRTISKDMCRIYNIANQTTTGASFLGRCYVAPLQETQSSSVVENI